MIWLRKWTKEIFFLSYKNNNMTTVKTLERRIKDAIKHIFVVSGYNLEKIHKRRVSSKIIKRKIGKFSLLMREDHQLPVFLKHLPYYSRNLPRLAIEVLKKYPNLMMIDIGANIGDTVALTRSECCFPIVCIDGDNDFFELLKENIKQFNDVSAYKQLLGEKNETIEAELKKSIETARLQHGGPAVSGGLLSVITLDSFIEKHKEFEQSKLLKIDTDGYDMKIVRGGLEYIKKVKPIIFLEYDPIFFSEQGDAGVPTLVTLESFGYDTIVFYDNLGKIIVSGELSNHLFLRQMNNYIDPKLRTPFPYYDVAIFHSEDRDIVEKFIEKEMRFFYPSKYYAQ